MIGPRLPVLVFNHDHKKRSMLLPSHLLLHSHHLLPCAGRGNHAAAQWSRSGNQTGLKLMRKERKTERKKRFAFSQINYVVPVHCISEQMLMPAGDGGQHQCKVVAWCIQQTTAHVLMSVPTMARNSHWESEICPTMPLSGHDPD